MALVDSGMARPRFTETFDLASRTGERAYREFVNDPTIRVLGQQDFFAVIGNGPEEPASPCIMRLVDAQELPSGKVPYRAPIC